MDMTKVVENMRRRIRRSPDEEDMLLSTQNTMSISSCHDVPCDVLDVHRKKHQSTSKSSSQESQSSEITSNSHHPTFTSSTLTSNLPRPTPTHSFFQQVPTYSHRSQRTPTYAHRSPRSLISRCSGWWQQYRMLAAAIVVLALLPASINASVDFQDNEVENLAATVRSHSQSLRNIGRYLTQTDKFWNWYRENHAALDALIADGHRVVSTKPVESDITLQSLQEQVNYLKVSYEDRLKVQEEKTRGLEAKMEEQEKEKSDLKDQVESLSQDLLEQKATSERLAQQLNQTQQDLANSDSTVRELSQKVGDEQSKVFMYIRNLVTQANRTNESLQEQVGGLASEMNSANSNLAEYERRMQRLEQQQRRFRGVRQQMATKEKVEELTVAVERLDNATSLVKDEMYQAKEDISTIQADSVTWETRLFDLTEELRTLKEDYNNFTRDIMFLIFPLEDSLKTMNITAETRIVRTEERLSDMEREVQQLQTRATSQKNQPYNLLQNQITNIQTQIANSQGRISRLDGRISGLEGSQVQNFQRRFQTLEDKTGSNNLEIVTLKVQTERRIQDIEKDIEEVRKLATGSNIFRNNVINGGSNIDPLESLIVPDDRQGSRRSTGPRGIPASQGNSGRAWNNRDAYSDPLDHSSGVWGHSGDLGRQGAPARQGNQGNRGAQGPPGPPGDQGRAGPPGRQGDQGSAGPPGRQGDQGRAGSPGRQGDQGNSGPRGSPGPQGPRGAPGPAG